MLDHDGDKKPSKREKREKERARERERDKNTKTNKEKSGERERERESWIAFDTCRKARTVLDYCSQVDNNLIAWLVSTYPE